MRTLGHVRIGSWKIQRLSCMRRRTGEVSITKKVKATIPPDVHETPSRSQYLFQSSRRVVGIEDGRGGSDGSSDQYTLN